MKLKLSVYTLYILTVAVLQSTVLDYIKVYGVKPNLLLVVTVSVALLHGSVKGASIGFLTGLIQDALSGKVMGFYSLLGLYLGLIIGFANRRLFKENLLVMIFFTFVSTLVYEYMVYFLNTFMQGGIEFVRPMRLVILPEALYNSVIAGFVHLVQLRLNRLFEGIEKVSRKY